MAEQFLIYLQAIQSKKSSYLGPEFLEYLDIQTKELNKGKRFFQLGELIALVNRINQLGNARFSA